MEDVKFFVRRGTRGNPVRLAEPKYFDVVGRWNGLGTAALAFEQFHPQLGRVLAPGARIICVWRGSVLLSGMVRADSGSFLAGSAPTIIQVQDDRRILRNILARVAPDNPLEAATKTDLAQAVATGTLRAGTVEGQGSHMEWPAWVVTVGDALRFLIDQNLPRATAYPYTIITETRSGSLPHGVPGLGADARSILPTVRFKTLDDIFEGLLALSGARVRVEQQADEKRVRIVLSDPRLSASIITPSSGIIAGGSWKREAPDITHSVIGGSGEASARAFVDFADADRAATWHDHIEVFRDATGHSIPWPDTLADAFRVPKYAHLRDELTPAQRSAFAAYLRAAGESALREGAAQASVSVDLAETAAFQIGGARTQLGDFMRIRSSEGSGGGLFTDRLTEIQVSRNTEGEEKVTPRVGEISGDASSQVFASIQRIARSERNRAAAR